MVVQSKKTETISKGDTWFLEPFNLLKCVCCLSFSVSDVENQQKMSELARKKDELTSILAVYKETFNTYNELLQLLTGTFYLFLSFSK